ncbi:Polysaccharide monooxygenase Cel61a [Fusarium oxysporum f. sp. albedinis]|nr:Polysaccharide monooxygenase Cel61a [Fusarium oxysporum f. sp. albedinis]
MRAETRVQVQTTIDGKRRKNEVQLMPIDSCPCQTWECATYWRLKGDLCLVLTSLNHWTSGGILALTLVECIGCMLIGDRLMQPATTWPSIGSRGPIVGLSNEPQESR